MSGAKRELRDLIVAALTDGMTAEKAADAALTVFYEVYEHWEDVVAVGVGGEPDRVLHQRFLIATVPCEALHQTTSDRGEGS